MNTVMRIHVATLSAFVTLKARAIEDRERGEITSQTFMIAAMVGLAVAVAVAISQYMSPSVTVLRNPPQPPAL